MIRPRISGSPLGGGGLSSLRDIPLMHERDMGKAEGGPSVRPFLRRGEGRLGMTTLPASAPTDGSISARSQKAQPVKRSLSLARPASARSPSPDSDADSFEEAAPRRIAAPSSTSYAGLLAQKEQFRKISSKAARPGTAPASRLRSKSPDEPMPRDPSKLVNASALSTAEGRRLQSMIRPVLLSTGRGGVGLSTSPNRSPTRSLTSMSHGKMSTIAAAERTALNAAPKSDNSDWDAVSEAIMRRARGEKPDTSRVLTDDFLVDTARDTVMEMCGAGHSISIGLRSPSAVDFSPVLQAVQGKLASLTQENIGLKEAV